MPTSPSSPCDRHRLWIVSELYYPETTSTGHFLTGIAEGLTTGYEVSILCGQPSYSARGRRAPKSEVRNGVRIRRCFATTLDKNQIPWKLINMLTFSLSVFLQSLRRFRPNDLIMAVTNPPLMPFLVALACWIRGAKFVLLVHDVYPDVLAKLGILNPSCWCYRTLYQLTAQLYQTSSRVIVLGRDMKRLALYKMGGLAHPDSRIAIATHWGETGAIQPKPRCRNPLLKELGLQNRFVVQCLGNIGRTHGIEDLIKVAGLLVNQPDFHFLLIGWGAKKQWAQHEKQSRELANLTILPPVAEADLCDGLNACDIAIIAFRPGMSGISVPSRMYNVLASGKPILAICDPDSELATVVREEQIGWVIPPGQPELVVQALLHAKSDPAGLMAMGQRARRAAELKYTRSQCIGAYIEVLNELRAKPYRYQSEPCEIPT